MKYSQKTMVLFLLILIFNLKADPKKLLKKPFKKQTAQVFGIFKKRVIN